MISGWQLPSLGDEKLEEIPLLLFLLSLRMKHTLTGFWETIPHPCLLVLCSGSVGGRLSLEGKNSAKKQSKKIFLSRQRLWSINHIILRLWLPFFESGSLDFSLTQVRGYLIWKANDYYPHQVISVKSSGVAGPVLGKMCVTAYVLSSSSK